MRTRFCLPFLLFCSVAVAGPLPPMPPNVRAYLAWRGAQETRLDKERERLRDPGKMTALPGHSGPAADSGSAIAKARAEQIPPIQRYLQAAQQSQPPAECARLHALTVQLLSAEIGALRQPTYAEISKATKAYQPLVKAAHQEEEALRARYAP